MQPGNKSEEIKKKKKTIKMIDSKLEVKNNRNKSSEKELEVSN